jgi:transcriptional regulator with XRE-family HTH domain
MERLSGMTTSQLSQVETGRRADPAFSTVVRIADALGLSLAEVADAMRTASKPEIRIDAGTRAAIQTAARLDEARRDAERSLAAILAAIKSIPSKMHARSRQRGG